MSSMPIAQFEIEQWLPFGLGLNDVIALMAGLAVVTTFLAIWHALHPNTSFERRLTQIVDRKEAMRQAAISSRRQRARVTPAGVMQELVTRLDLLRSRHATEARSLLARAGMRSREAMIRYLFARLTLPVVFAFAVFADSYTLRLLPIPQGFGLAAIAAGGVLGYLAPGIYLRNLTTKRAHRLELGLPDALDLMVICAEAGLSLDATLMRVSREMEINSPEIAEEFGITAAELTFLPDRRQAFDNLNNRTDLGSIRGVVNTLMQTAKFGTPLAQSLRVLATEFRDARLFRAEEKAARLPALMTVPMILFILPTLFIVLMGPAALGIIDTFSGGKGGGPRQVAVVKHGSGGSSGSGSAEDTQVTEVNGSQPTSGGTTGATAEPASLIVDTKEPKVGSPLTIQVDARALASDSNLRVVLVPEGTSDDVTEPGTFFAEAKTITATRAQVSLTPHAAGRYEARLYFVPSLGSHDMVAARTSVEVK